MDGNELKQNKFKFKFVETQMAQSYGPFATVEQFFHIFFYFSFSLGTVGVQPVGHPSELRVP